MAVGGDVAAGQHRQARRRPGNEPAVEVRSLALLSDAGAIGAALWAIRLAARPAAGAWTFGWKRSHEPGTH